jgi:hypothetical protein
MYDGQSRCRAKETLPLGTVSDVLQAWSLSNNSLRHIGTIICESSIGGIKIKK